MPDDLDHPLTDRDAVQADSYGDAWAAFLDDWVALNASIPDPDMLDRLEADARRVPDSRVLELGVGTGFVAIPLAARGIAVVGLDGSPGMLDRLQANAAGAPIEGVLADFTDFDLGETFGLVYFCSSSLYCLPSADAQASCLRAIARHVDADGRFVIAAYVHDDAWYDVHNRRESIQSQGDGWRMHWSARHVPAEQRVLVTRTLHRDGEADRVFPHQERYLTTDQLDNMATAAGLTLIERSADWKRTPYASNRRHVSTYALAP